MCMWLSFYCILSTCTPLQKKTNLLHFLVSLTLLLFKCLLVSLLKCRFSFLALQTMSLDFVIHHLFLLNIFIATAAECKICYQSDVNHSCLFLFLAHASLQLGRIQKQKQKQKQNKAMVVVYNRVGKDFMIDASMFILHLQLTRRIWHVLLCLPGHLQ